MTQSQSLAPQHDPRSSFNLFGPEVSQAEVQRLVVANAPIYNPGDLTQLKNDIMALARQGRKVRVAVVWRAVQIANNAMPSPFQLSRGDALIDQDGDLAIRYWKNLGNSDEVSGKTFKLPYQEPGVIEYSFIGFSEVRPMKESVAPQHVPQQPVAVNPPASINPGALQPYGMGEEEEDEKPRKMQPLFNGFGSMPMNIHDVGSIVNFVADMVGRNQATATIIMTVMAEVDRQSSVHKMRFQGATYSASRQAVNTALEAMIEDGFQSERLAMAVHTSIQAYRVVVATSIHGAKRVDQAIARSAVNVPKDDGLGQSLARLSGRGGRGGRSGGRGGRGGLCSHCGKYGHTVENCWQKQGNASRGDAGKSTRQ